VHADAAIVAEELDEKGEDGGQERVRRKELDAYGQGEER
jgi:hypothetical protein